MRCIIKKLKRDRSGFSLAETLIAILILLMVTAVVGGAIPTASDVFTKTVDAANAQVVLSTAMNMLRGELSMAQEIDQNNSTSQSIIYKYIVKEKIAGVEIENYRWQKIEFGSYKPLITTTVNVTDEDGNLVLDDDGEPTTNTVLVDAEENVTGIWVFTGQYDASSGAISYPASTRRLLVSQEAITKNLAITLGYDSTTGSVSFNTSNGVITFTNLAVVKDGKTLATRSAFEVRTLLKDRS
jgi:type II secretory pathway pseudopilin PulG